MIEVPLALVWTGQGAPTDAWLIGGGDAAEWFRALAASNVDWGRLRFAMVPRDGRLAAAMVLCIPPDEPLPARAVPLTRLGANLLVPAGARLLPRATEAELDAMLPLPTCLLHPVFGLVGFEDADLLRVEDLLAGLPQGDVAWDRAVPGVTIAPRLVAIAPEPRDVLEEFFASAGDDIGSSTDESMPPSPDESKLGGRNLLHRLAHRALDFTDEVPRTASHATWVNWLESVAQRVLGDEVLERRKREIDRLMRLLMSDPDAGLRYALPLHGDRSNRGRARPGTRLSVRDPSRIPRRGGGGPIDPWDLDPRERAELEKRYRELARRELALGRFQRAAYIEATLLGDMRAAAATLERGGLFREAAAIYAERLRDRGAAAACLERGGLWSEALESFRALKNLPRVAHLLERLDRHAEAVAIHREIVAADLQRGDRIAAASRLERHLDEPDAALELLAAAWPDDAALDPCVAAWFAIAARHSRFGMIRAWIAARRDERHDGRRAVVFTLHASAFGASAADRALASFAADAVRVVVGRHVGVASAGQRTALLRSLRELDPRDRLLARDTVRYEARLIREERRVVFGGDRKIRELEVSRLPFAIDFETSVCSDGDVLLVLHYSLAERELILHCKPFDASTGDVQVRWPAMPSRGWSMLHTGGHHIGVFATRGDERVARQEFRVGPQRWVAGTPDAWPQRTIGAAPDVAAGTWSLDLNETGSLSMQYRDARGVRGDGSADLELAPDELWAPTPMVAIGGGVVFATQQRLIRYRRGIGFEVISDESVPRTRLVRSARHTVERLLATRADGGCESWTKLETDRPRVERFATDVERPVVWISATVGIVVADEHGIAIYRTRDGTVSLEFRERWQLASELLHIVAGARANEFCALTRDGSVRRFAVG